MKILVVTNMYPNPERKHFGIFVEEQVESLRGLGMDVDVLFIDGKESKLNYLRGFPRLWKQLRSKKYDIVHAHYIFAGLIARAQVSCPVVLTHHGPEVFMTWQAWVCRAFTRFFHSVIVVSEEMRRKLNVPYATVIPCGINVEDFKPMPREELRRELGLPLDKKLVLWAGEHTRPEKRYELVLAAMEIVTKERPDVELVLLSGKSHDAVPKYMNACDALVLTSDGEGSPMVIKEAMACNLPAVSTEVGDVRERFKGTDGYFICSQEPSDIALKVKMAVDRNGVASGREAVLPLALDEISKRIIDVYKRTLRSPATNESESTVQASESESQGA